MFNIVQLLKFQQKFKYNLETATIVYSSHNE